MEKIIEEYIDTSVRRNMLDFAQASFVDRYPDVRDGLKPIHRRIIYGMYKLGLTHRGSFMKCGKVVGSVMGDYHPHGDIPIYGALVAMAQPFTLNHNIIEGQGNFGNALGDGPASARYTECRFDEYSTIFTKDLSDESVHYVPTYSNLSKEPTVLPTTIPNLLINGNYTIGGAAFNSSIPPHNLSDVVDLTIELIKNPKLTNEYIGGKLLPDFAFGGILINPEEIKEFYQHGTPTSIKMKSKYTIDENERKIHILELPYLVDGNTLKDEIIRKFPKLKEIGIDSVEDDCDETTMEIVITYSKSANPHKIIDILQTKTRMKSSAQLILTCTVDGKLIENCQIKTLFVEWIKFRREIVRKVITLEIQKIYRETHVLEALIASYDKLDTIIAIIRKASSKEEIHNELISKFKFTILQAQAIAGMKLYELSKMGKDALITKYNTLMERMNVCRAKLNNKTIDEIIISELKDAKSKFGRPRRTQIVSIAALSAKAEIPVDVLISRNVNNNVSIIRKDKLLSKDISGKMIAGSRTNEVQDLLLYNTVNDALFAVTNYGYLYRINDVKSYIDSSALESTKWESLTIQVSPRLNERIVSLLVIPKCNLEDSIGDIVVVTTGNIIKRMNISVIPKRVQSNGSRFISVPENVPNYIQLCKYLNPEDGPLIAYAISSGHVHVYPYSQLRECGKSAAGVSATTSSLPITDIMLCKESDVVYMCKSNGECIATKVSQIPQKKRTAIPYKLIMNVSGKRIQDQIMSIRKHVADAKGIVICGKDGQNCVVSDDVILESLNSGALKQIVPSNISISQVSSVIEV